MKKLLITLVLIGSISILFSSCKTGYGCRANQCDVTTDLTNNKK